MPGATIGNLIPAWLRPENASVLDSPMVKGARTLASLLGINDPQSEALTAAMPVAIGIAPRRSLAELVGLISDEAPTPARMAVKHLAERYPRLMSHVMQIDARAGLNSEEAVDSLKAGFPTRVTLGRMQALGSSVFPNSIASGAREMTNTPIASIAMDSRVHDLKPATYVDTLGHELTHVAQNLRQTDRAVRSVEALPFEYEYARQRYGVGYDQMPFEQAALKTGEKKAAEFPMINHARRLLDFQVNDPVAVMKGLYPDATDTEIGRAMNIARTMAQRAAQ